MKSLDWIILESKHQLKDRWISVRADKCQTPDGHIIEPYYVLEYPDYVHIFAITKNQEVVLIRQYRHGAGKTLLELPSGCVEKNDTSPIEAARRELLEETGYTSDKFIHVGRLSPNPANHSNVSHCILAMEVEYVAEKKEDFSEIVEVVLMPLKRVRQKLYGGEFIQALYVSTMFYSLNYLGELQNK